MFEILKEDYTLFIRDYKGRRIGVLTLKDDNVYKDVDELGEDELVFLYTFNNIEPLINDDTALSVVYDKNTNQYVSSIKKKIITGEYNDKIVWNTSISSKGPDFMQSLDKLDQNLAISNERNKAI